ncbi:hypothetical protein ANANG_G00019290 [Anguilla anguilla]|uniref:Fibronectin type-III domain-containing protein n=1 Tax=Anguilla anguilla TaxID=7936 RepID=A0A9D3N119_ANGAN|nr:hypothetical protein ANANG_G00019290 [Anguilla anguilla]
MPLLLICILSLSVFWRGGCQRGDEQIPQFNFTVIDTTTITGTLPDSSDSMSLRNQTENISSSTPLSITEDVSHEDSWSSTPPTNTIPMMTPSLDTVMLTMAPANTDPTLTESDTNTMLTTEATNTTTILSTSATNRSASLITAATSKTAMLTTAATSLSAATNSIPAVTLTVDKINPHKDNDKETNSPSLNGEATTTQMPSITSPKMPAFNGQNNTDYSDDKHEEEEEEEMKKRRRDMPKCVHDPCAHLQLPCLLVSQGSCMCPGLTLNSVTPAPPLAVDAQDVTDSSAEVRWCAPYSSVSGYELQVREEASGALTSHALEPTFRRFRLTALGESRAYSVCVVAKNLAGPSRPRCTALKTSKGTAAVTYYLAAAVAGLAVLALVLAVCLCRHCRKPPLENQRNTSLISIRNPAYYHPQETADILKV